MILEVAPIDVRDGAEPQFEAGSVQARDLSVATPAPPAVEHLVDL